MAFAIIGKTIQTFDKKSRPFRGHNIELDARSTLKIGLKIADLNSYSTYISGYYFKPKWEAYDYKDLIPNWTRNYTYSEIENGIIH